MRGRGWRCGSLRPLTLTLSPASGGRGLTPRHCLRPLPVLLQHGATRLDDSVGDGGVAFGGRVERAGVGGGEQKLEPGEGFELQDLLQQRLRDMEVRSHEGVVGRAEPALARGIGLVVGRVVGAPSVGRLARQAQVVGNVGAVIRGAGTDAAAEKVAPVAIDERPLVVVGCFLHRRVELVGDPCADAQLGLAHLQIAAAVADPALAGRVRDAVGGPVGLTASEVVDAARAGRGHVGAVALGPIDRGDGGREDFGWLKKPEVAQNFLNELEGFIMSLPVLGIAAVIDRPGYVARYKDLHQDDLWFMGKTAYCILIERAAKYARSQGRVLRVFFEECGKREDRELIAYHKALKKEGSPFNPDNSAAYGSLTSDDFRAIVMGDALRRSKKVPMLQVADLMLYPMVKAGYDSSYGPFVRLMDAGKLLDAKLASEDRAKLGIKYSCFDSWK